MRSSVRRSDMIPVLEVQIPSNMSAALNLCFLCNLGSPSQSSSIRTKTFYAPNTATLRHNSYIHANIRSIHRFPPNRAIGVVVFEGSPFRYKCCTTIWSTPRGAFFKQLAPYEKEDKNANGRVIPLKVYTERNN